MKIVARFSSALLIFVLVAYCFLFFNNDIGIPKSTIEKDARNSQNIKDNWQVAKDITKNMSIMVFYPNDLSDHTFSIYVNRPRLSFGYFFKGGGSLFEIEEYIAEFVIENYNERIFASMNQQQVCRIEINDRNNIQTIHIDSEKPFAFILPSNTSNVTIYDIHGNIIQSIQHRL